MKDGVWADAMDEMPVMDPKDPRFSVDNKGPWQDPACDWTVRTLGRGPVAPGAIVPRVEALDRFVPRL